ncbi:cytidine deaminase [Mangrovivirga sp. M17]|uniref:Cytidine deaminase n=1 Tax=Mangrovivirga halotolerans TaxID=2993936 RepID=A0ABT3RVK7_9BACT|nr:cytidine deaminase [Mangrovivirga halotolerans]MCX2745796.1 cytidine deaminase [Mangrovivirga halotolerans]
MTGKTKSININYTEYDSFEDLTKQWQNLVKKAEEACETAYAPYSHFKVGAALELENGTIIKGNNQENAAYPSGLCAERVALFTAHSQYPDQKIKKLTICAINNENKKTGVSPCGGCRQVMVEFSKENNIEVLLKTKEGKFHLFNSALDLVPFNFNKKNLDG